MNNFRSSLFIVGNLLIFFSFYLVIPFIVDLSNNGTDWRVFISIAAFCFFIGFNISFVFKNKKKDVGIGSAFFLTLICWIVLTIIGALPFYLGSLNLTFIDSFFESMSGMTTTGATVLTNLDETPKSILIWRAMLQWLGGIGIIVMAITLMPIMNVGGMQLFKISNNDSTEKILPKSKEIALRLIYIYVALTTLCLICYKFLGMNIFDSLTHSMTTLSTGGFSNYNQSIGFFCSLWVLIHI